MDALWSLVGGFAVALQPANLLFALVGCVIGTAVGVLPGIGPIAGIAILLPLTFNLDATGAIIMLGGDLLRRDVRRHDHHRAHERPRRGRIGHHRDRRLRDGQAGPGRRGAGHRRDRLVHRRHGRHRWSWSSRRRRWPGWRWSSGRRSFSA